MGVVNRPVVQPAVLIERNDTVCPWGIGELRQRAAGCVAAQHGGLGSGVLEADRAGGITGHKAFIPWRGRDGRDGGGVGLHHMNFTKGEFGRIVPVTDLKPDTHPPGLIAHDERAVANQPGHGPDGSPPLTAQARLDLGRSRVANIPMDDFTGFQCGKQVALFRIQRQHGGVRIQRRRELEAVFRYLRLAQEGFFDCSGQKEEGARAEQGGQGHLLLVFAGVLVGQRPNRAALRVEDNRRVFRDLRRADAGLALERDREGNRQGNDHTVRGAERRGVGQVAIVDRSDLPPLQGLDCIALKESVVRQREKINRARPGNGVGDLSIFIDAQRQDIRLGSAANQVGQRNRRGLKLRGGCLPEGQGFGHDHEKNGGDAQNNGKAAKGNQHSRGLINQLFAPESAFIFGRRETDADRLRSVFGRQR